MATIVRYEPFVVARPLGELADRLFRGSSAIPRPWNGRVAPGSSPAPSLYETAEGYELQVPLPGVPADDLEVSLHNDVVTIKGQRTVAVPEKATRLWWGVQSGEFHFAWRLPGEVAADEMQAHLADGVLRLTLPKAQHQRPRRIAIEAHTASRAA